MHNKLLTTDLFLFRTSREKISANELEEEEGLRGCLQEPQGAKPLKKSYEEPVSVWVETPALHKKQDGNPRIQLDSTEKHQPEHNLHGCLPPASIWQKFSLQLLVHEPQGKRHKELPKGPGGPRRELLAVLVLSACAQRLCSVLVLTACPGSGAQEEWDSQGAAPAWSCCCASAVLTGMTAELCALQSKVLNLCILLWLGQL